MVAIGYILLLCLLASLAYAFYGFAVGQKMHLKFGVIASFTFAGLLAMWPPNEKLKLGIDLSGGTILVYEASKDNQSASFNMNDLISALKHRVDPQGIKEIPIRMIGGNRLEIILPADEDVDEVKRLLTDVGALKFRILANRKHDQAITDRALAPNGRTKSLGRYKWARLGEVASGTNPTFTSKTITDLTQDWKKNRYAGGEIELTGK